MFNVVKRLVSRSKAMVMGSCAAVAMAVGAVVANATETTPTVDVTSVVTPLLNSMVTSMLSLITLIVPIAFSVYIVFWGIKFLKGQIAKNAH